MIRKVVIALVVLVLIGVNMVVPEDSGIAAAVRGGSLGVIGLAAHAARIWFKR